MAKWHGKQYSKKGLRRYPKYNPVYRKFQKFGAGAAGAALGFIGGNLAGAGSGWYAGRKLYSKRWPQKYMKRTLSVNSTKYGRIGSNKGPVLSSPGNGNKTPTRTPAPFWPRHKRAHVHKFFTK